MKTKSTVIISLIIVILCVFSTILLRETPILSPWKNWKVLSVDVKIPEKKKFLLQVKLLSTLETQITGCVCLAMHRKEGWGFERIKQLLIYIQDIKEEFDYDRERIVKAAYKEAGYDWEGREALAQANN